MAFVQISMKKIDLGEKESFMNKLYSMGYTPNVPIDMYTVGLLLDQDTKTIKEVMTGKLLYQPGVGEVPTIKAERF